MITPSASSRDKAPALAMVVMALFGALALLVTGGANWMLKLSARKAAMVTAEGAGPFQMESSGTTSNLRGIHAVGGEVAWASGAAGTVLRTEDSGHVWQRCAVPPGAEKLDFRAIWAWDADNAVVMSSGSGDQSRLYKTTDGCSHWKLLYTNPDAKGFWDAMQFWYDDPPGNEEGLIVGDPVDGYFAQFNLGGRGDAVARDKGVNALAANPGESAFAASNSSLALAGRFTEGHSTVTWLGTGGTSGARVYGHRMRRAADFATGGWVAVPVPLASGTDSAGVFSLAFRDQQHGIAVGGDYQKPDSASGTAAWTADGGETWTAVTKPPHGYRSTVAWDERDKLWITAGTNGADISEDDGKTWTRIDDGNWNAISLPWIVGPAGRIAKLVSLNLPPRTKPQEKPKQPSN